MSAASATAGLHLSPTSSSSQAAPLFASLDSDGDGWLVAADLAEFIEDPKKLDEIWSMLDSFNEGRVDLEAFERCFSLFAGDDDADHDDNEAEESTDTISSPLKESFNSATSTPLVAPVPTGGMTIPPAKGHGGITIPAAGSRKACQIHSAQSAVRAGERCLSTVC
jgi:hypothetical protein